MGTWGHRPFENDSALDWVNELQRLGPEELRRVLAQAADQHTDAYLDVDDGSAVVAAAEVLATAIRPPKAMSERVPPSVQGWLELHRDHLQHFDVDLAVRALQRVLREPSELLGLWGASSAWGAEVDALILGLTARGA